MRLCRTECILYRISVCQSIKEEVQVNANGQNIPEEEQVYIFDETLQDRMLSLQNICLPIDEEGGASQR